MNLLTKRETKVKYLGVGSRIFKWNPNVVRHDVRHDDNDISLKEETYLFKGLIKFELPTLKKALCGRKPANFNLMFFFFAFSYLSIHKIKRSIA